MRPTALVGPLALVVLGAVPARAQDDDPLVRAVRDQEALRARQMEGVRRAEDKTYDPLRLDTLDAHPAAGAPAPRGAAPSGRPPSPWGGLPWLLAGAGACMLGLLAWLSLRRPSRRES